MENFRRNISAKSHSVNRNIPQYNYMKGSNNFYVTGNKGFNWYLPYYYGYPNINYLYSENDKINTTNSSINTPIENFTKNSDDTVIFGVIGFIIIFGVIGYNLNFNKK